jgi:hypothetical protein
MTKDDKRILRYQLKKMRKEKIATWIGYGKSKKITKEVMHGMGVQTGYCQAINDLLQLIKEYDR